MPAEHDKRSLHAQLVDRILHGPGQAAADQRAAAFANAGVPEAVRALVEKVATDSAQVSDADFAAGRAAGFTDEETFELVICAAVGQATRQYTTGLAALAEATGEETAG
jgi:hypothetical protein